MRATETSLRAVGRLTLELARTSGFIGAPCQLHLRLICPLVSSRQLWQHHRSRLSATVLAQQYFHLQLPLSAQKKQTGSFLPSSRNLNASRHAVVWSAGDPGPSSREVGPVGDYPQGKPTWEHLQHIAARLADTVY